jgi:fatty acid desaturase
MRPTNRLKIDEMLKPPKSGESKSVEIRWWRNQVALITAMAGALLIAVLLIGSALWVTLVVAVSVLFGVKQIIQLTHRAKEND